MLFKSFCGWAMGQITTTKAKFAQKTTAAHFETYYVNIIKPLNCQDSLERSQVEILVPGLCPQHSVGGWFREVPRPGQEFNAIPTQFSQRRVRRDWRFEEMWTILLELKTWKVSQDIRNSVILGIISMRMHEKLYFHHSLWLQLFGSPWWSMWMWWLLQAGHGNGNTDPRLTIHISS